ncbi:hypothetical protein GH714_038572 [Hevea brasiliensis]|uniref:Uncharacterized protein n=1 Tax=Hevea brasiliensis TaxID=3981 RepID=A0A6A6N6Q1_HEVBR|nr:hypothetical protein GH714_038572 [Hevea brasiliensis]
MEVERQGADNLASAIAIAESLVEYKKSDKDKEKDKGKNKPYKGKSGGDFSHNSCPTHTKEGGSKKFKEFKRQEGPSKGQHFKKNGDRLPLKCFLCDIPHRAWDYPKKAGLSALVEQVNASPQPKEGVSMGSLQLAVVQAKPREAIKEKMGCLFVQASLGGKEVRALVDTGASDNFLKLEKAQCLGIRFTPERGWLKAVNSNPSPIHGVAHDVPVKLSGTTTWTFPLSLWMIMLVFLVWISWIRKLEANPPNDVCISQPDIPFETCLPLDTMVHLATDLFKPAFGAQLKSIPEEETPSGNVEPSSLDQHIQSNNKVQEKQKWKRLARTKHSTVELVEIQSSIEIDTVKTVQGNSLMNEKRNKQEEEPVGEPKK